MRYAILADVHANRQALQAVLADCRAQRVDVMLSLGDLIGYGPAPEAVLELGNARIHYLIRGNHEAALLGQMPADRFREDARRALEWTAARLTPKARRFVTSWPMVLAGPGFRCVHAEFADPCGFQYLLAPADAIPSWTAAEEPLLFTGHTHAPGLFVIGASGITHHLPPTDFEIEPGKRYLVGAGSVGQPRDGDIRAAWVLYDSDLRTVWFRRTAFDVDAFRHDLRLAGLSEAPCSCFAQAGAPPEPLRECLDFVPPNPAPPEQRLTPTVAVLEATRRSALRWRRIGLMCVLLAGVLGLALAGAWWQWHPRGAAWPATVTRPLAFAQNNDRAGADPVEVPLPEFAASGTTAPLAPPLPDWSVRVADAAAQTVRGLPAVGKDSSRLRLQSAGNGVIEIVSRPVQVTRGMRFKVVAKVCLAEARQGYAELALCFTGSDGVPRILKQKSEATGGLGGWRTLEFTLPKPTDKEKQRVSVPGNGQLQLLLRGDFTGACEFRKPALRLQP